MGAEQHRQSVARENRCAVRGSRQTLLQALEDRSSRELRHELIFRRPPELNGSHQLETPGTRDVSRQASTLLARLSAQTLDDLRDGDRELLERTEKRARELA
ncbi:MULTISPECIES: hypothetical protein [unclassified Streptomyces]|uniref:hypothetical protein n=1 Tax=unclassified Streptomyces TaxID=2593676 RepID=UPI0022504BDD|nr:MULTISPECIES: hypothetical protein [unclassified Streptomyces]MCX4580796.1 hypothetical protein [Streptomyces sp. NBC_01571]